MVHTQRCLVSKQFRQDSSCIQHRLDWGQSRRGNPHMCCCRYQQISHPDNARRLGSLAQSDRHHMDHKHHCAGEILCLVGTVCSMHCLSLQKCLPHMVHTQRCLVSKQFRQDSSCIQHRLDWGQSRRGNPHMCCCRYQQISHPDNARRLGSLAQSDRHHMDHKHHCEGEILCLVGTVCSMYCLSLQKCLPNMVHTQGCLKPLK